jgi:hypothetical protein
MTRQNLTIADLTLSGTDEPFYLEPGETVLWIRNQGSRAIVRLRTAEGFEDLIDANLKVTA